MEQLCCSILFFYVCHVGSNGNGGSSSDNARMVGRRLAALGDEIDGMYKEQFEDIVGLYENPQEAFSSFSSVLGNLMNWEEGQLRESIMYSVNCGFVF